MHGPRDKDRGNAVLKRNPCGEDISAKLCCFCHGSDSQNQQVVTMCLIIQQTKHGRNRTTPEKLCHIQQRGLGLFVCLLLKDISWVLSVSFCATKPATLLKTDVMGDRRNS